MRGSRGSHPDHRFHERPHPGTATQSSALRNIGVNALFYKQQWSEFLREIVELYVAGAVMPEVEGEYPLEALPDLCDRLQRREVQGKAVIRVC